MSEGLTIYQAILGASLSALAIVLGLIAWKQVDYRIRRLEIGRRKRRRKGWL